MEPRKQLEQALIEKAMKDESFRKQLIEDPRSVIQEEFKMKIPDSLNLIVLEEDQKTFYLILPSNPSPGEEMELTEAELEGVSGGNMYSIGCEYT
ncbi:MAG: NHLP leader peptide family RiPP precursor [Bacteroidota bacterium]